MRNLILATATALTLTTGVHAAGHSLGMVSKHDVKTTTQKLVSAIEKAGATVFAVIDHQANAQKAGLEMPPATLVIFGNPKMGTAIMNADINAGIDLPVRVLITGKDGTTHLQAVSPAELEKRYDLKGAQKPLEMMGGALNNLMKAASN